MSETKATPEATIKSYLTPDQVFEAAVDAAKKANPGTEVREYQNPTLEKVRVLFRGMTRSEARVYSKKLAEQQERGEMGDVHVAFEHAIFSAVLVPDKAALIDMMASYPMCPSAIAGEICELTGLDNNAKSKKR